MDRLHARGVHVLWPYNPWDQGTHGGNPRNLTAAWAQDARRLAGLMVQTDADGFFGDTIGAGGLEEFYRDSVKAGRPSAIQPEAGGTLAGLNYTTWGWGYWANDQRFLPPLVDKLKWIEPRYLTQPCARWDTDDTDFLQTGYFNGEANPNPNPNANPNPNPNPDPDPDPNPDQVHSSAMAKLNEEDEWLDASIAQLDG